MPLNDDIEDEFSSKIEDETTYPDDAHGVLAPDYGSGSNAEDGPTEIGGGTTEIGRAADLMVPFESFMLDDMRIGAADRDDAEIGGIGDTLDSQYEIGSAAMFGPSEIGSSAMFGPSEIGSYAMYGPSEIGAMAAVKVIEKARDNRQPAPPMKAVDVDAPPRVEEDWSLTDVVIGAAVATGGVDPFPLTSALMLRCGVGCPPRFVRVDTEDSYRAFRAENSPELAALSDHVAQLEQRLSDHIVDPDAHSDLEDDIATVTELGAEAEVAEAQKRVDLWLPKRYDGLVTAWREGEFVCASLALPGSDGEVRICTSMEPVRKCVSEMARHAAEAGVPAATVVGVLPAMGCVLGAGTAIKEMAAAAPAILQRPEANTKASFMVRIEPKDNPALAALAMLVMACKAGDQQACDEWRRLGELSAPPVKQAMLEAVQLAKSAA